jgi:hypothetical protein
MMEQWKDGKRIWNNGKIESWNNGKTIKTFIPNIPFFQYSSIPCRPYWRLK